MLDNGFHAPHKTTISHVLRQLVKDLKHKQQITFGQIVTSFGERVFGLVMILFALPSALPLSVIPGFSFIFGLPIVFVALHLILGRQALWLPAKLSNRLIDGAKISMIINKTVPTIRYIERWLKPRGLFFSTASMQRLHGATLLGLSMLLLLPIPFSNFILASLIIIFGLGFTEKDGLFLLAAYVGFFLYCLVLASVTVGLMNMVVF